MPLLELTYPEGSLSPDARDALAGELTAIVLRAERAPEIAFTREITWVDFHELPAGMAYMGAAPSAEPRFRLEVTIPDRALSNGRRAGLVEQATRAITRIAGLDDDMRVWVIVREIPDGRWGANGRVLPFDEVRAMVASAAA